MSNERLVARRAIEALRSGVPNRDAVRKLPSYQTEAEDRFSELLDAVARPEPEQPAAGMLLGGGFGSGKSHLLASLAHRALDAGFVVSRVVISKETALHQRGSVFRSAVEAAALPDRTGSALDELTAALDPQAEGYGALRRWVNSAPGLDSRFAATLYLWEQARRDPELSERILLFWAGQPLPAPELRKRLKEAGADKSYRVGTVSETALAGQRFRFLARLIRAAGYRGWILLLDEVELIGRYSLLQRAKSYGEVARWIRGDREDPGAPLGAVLATVDDFEAHVLVEKNDQELVGKRLRQKGTLESENLATLAEDGMKILARSQLRLRAPDREVLDRTYGQLKALHGLAYAWSPRDVEGLERLPSNRMRQYVRAWINEWDLARLDPSYVPSTTVEAVDLSYSEDSALEGEAEASPQA